MYRNGTPFPQNRKGRINRAIDSFLAMCVAGCALSAFALPFIVYLTYVFLLALWTDRNVDFWVSQATGQSENVHYLWSVLLTFFTGPFIWIVNIVAEIARHVVV